MGFKSREKATTNTKIKFKIFITSVPDSRVVCGGREKEDGNEKIKVAVGAGENNNQKGRGFDKNRLRNKKDKINFIFKCMLC